MKPDSWNIPGGAALALLLLCAPAPAATAAPQTADSPAAEAADAAEAAREARIQEYLRKREEKRAQKARLRDERTEARRAEDTARAEQKAMDERLRAEAEMAEEEDALTKAALAGTAMAAGGDEDAMSPESRLPKRLAEAQDIVRHSRLGADPTVQRYLELVDRQAASPDQLAAFGNFIAEAGMHRPAMEYYNVAVRLDKRNPLLWVNLGTLHRQVGELGEATDAYGKAVSLDRTHAVAHYNLGATYDAMGKYEQAVEEYKIALTLDPTLSDPSINPQAANNERLIAVRLLLYQEQIGTLGMPLIDVPEGKLPENE